MFSLEQSWKHSAFFTFWTFSNLYNNFVIPQNIETITNTLNIIEDHLYFVLSVNEGHPQFDHQRCRFEPLTASCSNSETGLCSSREQQSQSVEQGFVGAPAVSWVTDDSSYSCMGRIQPALPVQGRDSRHWLVAGGCSVCGGECRPWSRDPDTDPRRTKERLHSLEVSLCWDTSD